MSVAMESAVAERVDVETAIAAVAMAETRRAVTAARLGAGRWRRQRTPCRFGEVGGGGEGRGGDNERGGGEDGRQ